MNCTLYVGEGGKGVGGKYLDTIYGLDSDIEPTQLSVQLKNLIGKEWGPQTGRQLPQIPFCVFYLLVVQYR